ncbi:YheV family putative zinc ribbon protein [Shewanella atlantica]|uniref:YheV family putative zinc ribbon protein n=1 Tax=Shewanella atlantica TaxID=271099 RepID=UPI0037366294
MAESRVKRRFVAGAKCPECKAMDSIVLFKVNGVETVECIDCDYSEQQSDEKVAKQAGGDVIGVFKP